MTPPAGSEHPLWHDVLERLREGVSQQQYETWFQDIRVTHCSRDVIDMVVPNSFQREWIRKRYADAILDHAEQATGGARPLLRIEVDPAAKAPRGTLSTTTDNEPTPAREEAATAPPPTPQPLLRSAAPSVSETQPNGPINPRYTLETLEVGVANSLARAAVDSLLAGSSPYNPLVLFGGVGVGKTHLLHALGHAFAARHPERRVVLSTAEQFLNAYIAAVDRNEVAAFRRHYREADLLVIDDLQTLANKDRTQQEFLLVVNAVVDAGHLLVVSADRSPETITGLLPRLTSCLRSGLVVVVEPPTASMRAGIIRRTAAREGQTLPPEVVEFLADGVRGSAREVIGATIRVLGTAALSRTPVSLALAQTVSSDVVGPRRNPVSIDQVAAVVTHRYAIRLPELQSRRRTKDVVVPRQICMFLARRLTVASLEAVGRYFGGRDHSTVLYGLERVEARQSEDEDFRRHLEDLSAEILRGSAREP